MKGADRSRHRKVFEDASFECRAASQPKSICALEGTMAMQRFRSAVDAWIVVVVVAGFAAQIAAIGMILVYEPPGPEKILVVGLMVLVLALLLWFFMRTYYVVGNGELKIVCGPFAWRISLVDIVAVEPSRALWSSPALSMDRLKISYGHGKSVLVSPADRRGFLKAIGHPGR
jgi:hypothetical protein